MMRTTLRIKQDLRGAQRLKRKFYQNNSRSIRIGWWNKVYPDGTSVAQVAAWNEHGHSNSRATTPPRPFIRLGFHPEAKVTLKSLAQPLRNVLEGRITWEEMFEGLAFDLQEKMREVIISWDTPPNTPYTISLKGMNNPLIDTGFMLDSVDKDIVRFTKREG